MEEIILQKFKFRCLEKTHNYVDRYWRHRRLVIECGKVNTARLVEVMVH